MIQSGGHALPPRHTYLTVLCTTSKSHSHGHCKSTVQNHWAKTADTVEQMCTRLTARIGPTPA